MKHWTAKTWSAREDRRQKLLSMSEERLREIMGPYLNEGAEVSWPELIEHALDMDLPEQTNKPNGANDMQLFQRLSPAFCPRCGNPFTMYEEQTMNALSRRDGETYICPSCGTAEALADLQGRNDLMEWDNPPEAIKNCLRPMRRYQERIQVLLEAAIAERNWAEEYRGFGKDEILDEANEEVQRLSQELSKCCP
mgnify:FL=1